MVKYMGNSWVTKNIAHKEAEMLLWLRAWQLMLLALASLVLASFMFGVWGCIGMWLALGLVALVAFLATGGQPGNAAQTFTTEMALGSTIALVVSGLFGFGVIFGTILDPEHRRV